MRTLLLLWCVISTNATDELSVDLGTVLNDVRRRPTGVNVDYLMDDDRNPLLSPRRKLTEALWELGPGHRRVRKRQSASALRPGSGTRLHPRSLGDVLRHRLVLDPLDQCHVEFARSAAARRGSRHEPDYEVGLPGVVIRRVARLVREHAAGLPALRLAAEMTEIGFVFAEA